MSPTHNLIDKLSDEVLEVFIKTCPPEQGRICEYLVRFIRGLLPNAREKMSYNVPFFSLKKRIAFVWPTCVKGSGVKEDGVLLGFWHGHLIKDAADKFRGKTNKIVRFVLYEKFDDLDDFQIARWIDEAVVNDVNSQ